MRRLAELLAYAATAIGDARDAYNTGQALDEVLDYTKRQNGT